MITSFACVCNCLKMHRGHFKFSITTTIITIITTTTKTTTTTETTTLWSTEAIRPNGFQWLTRYPFWTMTGLDFYDHLSICSFVSHAYLFIFTTFSSCPFVNLVYLSICSAFFHLVYVSIWSLFPYWPSCLSVLFSVFPSCHNCLYCHRVRIVNLFTMSISSNVSYINLSALSTFPFCLSVYAVLPFILSVLPTVCLVVHYFTMSLSSNCP